MDYTELKISKDEFRELVMTQINKGNQLLDTQFKPNKSFGRCNASPSGYHYEYAQEDKDKFKELHDKWFSLTKEIFVHSFNTPWGMENQYLKEFENASAANINIFTRDYIATQKKSLRLEINKLESILERLEYIPIRNQDNMNQQKKEYSTDIFIVHGHNNEIKESVARVVENLGLKAIILHEQPNNGQTIFEKLEKKSKKVDFAIILMTADDFGRSKDEQKEMPRARQNVIIEMGYFIGKLGRHRVMTLLEEGVEKPGDIAGIVYTPIDSAGKWKYDLISELQDAGYEIDANKLTKRNA